jgi:hypothetical protein
MRKILSWMSCYYPSWVHSNTALTHCDGTRNAWCFHCVCSSGTVCRSYQQQSCSSLYSQQHPPRESNDDLWSAVTEMQQEGRQVNVSTCVHFCTISKERILTERCVQGSHFIAVHGKGKVARTCDQREAPSGLLPEENSDTHVRDDCLGCRAGLRVFEDDNICDKVSNSGP